MPVDVYKPDKKEKKDPLDTIFKVAQIGATVSSFAGDKDGKESIVKKEEPKDIDSMRYDFLNGKQRVKKGW